MDKDTKYLIFVFLVLCLALMSTGCGQEAHYRVAEQVAGEDGKDGSNGRDGAPGEDAVIHTSVDAPDHGGCYEMAPGVYVENEGDHADVYDNPECEHTGVYCNNIHEQEVCPLGNLLIYIEDSYSNMVIHMLEFGGEE